MFSERPERHRRTLLDVVESIGLIAIALLPMSFLFAGASLISRLGLATAQERQQLKWFAYAAAIMIGGLLIGFLLGSVPDLMWDVGIFVGLLGFMFFPVATAIGILRYRLYDIDRVINRTIVYGLLTAMLVAVYFGGVATTEEMFRALTGQEKPPQLAVVVSTLAIAALFMPLRRRIQSFIDRRFYRRKYDARKTMEAFSTKLRDETDLEALNNDLVGVVRETRCNPLTSLCGCALTHLLEVSGQTSRRFIPPAMVPASEEHSRLL